MNTDPKQWQVGLVGYGEVGQILAEDLRAQGVGVSAYDLRFDTRAPGTHREHARRHGVVLASSAAGLAAGSDLVISAVTASQALAVADACRPGLRNGSDRGAFFLDLNSASPGTKVRAAGQVNEAGGRYVEGAVMTSVPPHRLRVPLLLGGPDAAALSPALNALGFASQPVDGPLGRVSATKMCRSVMIKGLEAMVVESFTAARRYGVEDDVIASLYETFPGIDWERQASYFFQRVIAHGRRRSEEMREVAATVQEAGLTPWSASGTAERQAWVADLADAGLFVGADLNDWREASDRVIGQVKGSGAA